MLEKMTAAGKTRAAVAVAIGRSREAVMRKAQDLGLPAPEAATASGEPELKYPVKLPPPEFGRLPLSVVNHGDWFRYGLVADTHLCCREERLAELHAQYDLFLAEGIHTVFHAGNIIDGYVAKINGDSVYETTIDGQTQYCVDNYPHRRGITTHFITGDDHDYVWFNKGFNGGAYLEYVAHQNDRTDLRYIGHVESDVEVVSKGTTGPVSTILKIQHPGGGSAYARSYTGQKIVESFEGGEKPSILISGHYHVSNYMNERNIHVVSLPGFQDQTIFARKKRLRMEVGGAILEFKVNPDDGSVTRCRVEFNRYFTRGYYKKWIKSDAKLCRGHLIISK
jgi:predicted phosphodiesterase